MMNLAAWLEGLTTGSLVVIQRPSGREISKVEERHGKNLLVRGMLFVPSKLNFRPEHPSGATLCPVLDEDIAQLERKRLWSEILRPLGFVETPMSIEDLRKIADHVKSARQTYVSAIREGQ